MANKFKFTGNFLGQKTAFLKDGTQATKTTYDDVRLFWGDTPLISVGTGASDGFIEVLEYEKDGRKIQNIAALGTILNIHNRSTGFKLFRGAIAFNDVLDPKKSKLEGEVKRSERVEGGYDPVQDIIGLNYQNITLFGGENNAGGVSYRAIPDIFPGISLPTFGSFLDLTFPGGNPVVSGGRIQLPDLNLGNAFNWYYQKKNKPSFNIPTFEPKERPPGYDPQKPDPKKPLKIGEITGVALEINGVDKYVQVQGKTDVNLFSLATLGVDIAGQRFIRIYDNNVDVAFLASLQFFDMGAVRINLLTVEMDTVKLEGKIAGEVLVRPWNSLKLGGNFGFRYLRNEAGVISGAQISSFGLYADNLNILMSTPESQIYLQRIGANFENVPPLLPGQSFNLNGQIGVSLGPSFEVDFPDWLGGSKKGQGISALRIDGGVTVKIPVGIDIAASLSILGFTIGQNRTFLNIDSAIRGHGVVLQSQTRMALPFDVVVLDGLFNIDARLNFQIRATASTKYPSFIPFVGGKDIGDATAMLKYAAPYHPTAQFRPEYGFVASWITWPRFLAPFFGDRVGTRITFGGRVDVIIGKDIEGFGGLGTVDSFEEFSRLATSETALAAYEQENSNDVLPTQSFEVSQGRKWSAVSIRWLSKNIIENPSSLFELVAPDGTVYTSDDFIGGDKVMLIDELSSDQGISLGIATPQAGIWTVRQVQPVDLGPVQIKMFENSMAPVAEIEEIIPDANGQWVDIVFSVADTDSDSVKVDIYMDTDGKGENGTLLTTIDHDPSTGNGTYRWFLNDVPQGNYHFFVTADDVENVTTVRYFTGGPSVAANTGSFTDGNSPIGGLMLGRGNDLPVVEDLSANWIGDGKFSVTWSDTVKPQYYNVRWSDNPAESPNNPIDPDFDGIQPTSGLVTIYKEEDGRFYHRLIVDGLTEGELYRFQIQSVDGGDRLGATGKTSLAVAGNYSTAIALGESDEWEYVAVLGETYTRQVSKAENETVTPLILPEGASYDPVTNQLIWQPTVDQLGEHWLQFKVENQFGDVYLETQRVQVLEYSLEQLQVINLPEDFDIFEYQKNNPINLNSLIVASGNGDSLGDDNLVINANPKLITMERGNNTFVVGSYTKVLGGAGNDLLQASPDNSFGGVHLNGGEGNDIIIGGEGDDTLLGSLGDDIIWWSLGDDFIDGGGGTDTLAGIQLLNLAESETINIKGIEIFQLADAGEVVLDQAAILAIAPDGNILRIEGDNGTIYLNDDWQQQGHRKDEDGNFILYTAGDATLAIEDSHDIIFLTGEVGTSLGQFNLDEFGDTLKNVSTFTLSTLPGWEYSTASEGFKLSLAVEPGDSSTIAIDLLPEHQGINTFLRQDPVTGIWTEFLFDGKVGAELIDSNNDGKFDRVLLHLEDGAPSDLDGLADGKVELSGLLATTTPGLATPVSGSGFLNGFGQPIPLTVRAVSLPTNGNFEFGFIKTDYDDFRGLVGAYDPTDEGWSAFIPLETQAGVFRNGERSSFSPVLEAAPADGLALNRTLAQQVLTSGNSLASTEHKAIGTFSQVTIEDAYSLTPYILDLNSNEMFSVEDENLSVTQDGRGFTQISADTPNGKYAVEVFTLPLVVPGLQGEAIATDIQIHRAGEYQNTLGLYKLANANGDIDINNDGIIDFSPGQAGYAEAAVRMTQSRDPLTGGITFSAPDNFSQKTATTQLKAGGNYGLFLISNGTTEQFLQQNPGNQPGNVNAFFMYDQANPDNESHFMRLGQSLYGVEDLFGGGDRDFNDLLISLDFAGNI
ncbi:DUF4114 domain-containing protein [Synechocystis sp. CACIAM 05]|uniref:DUF4114 domain-containing protein n=1 Tax=Synechocystis sp. CACIAM 05 TaxID=1933929 RepID=UPI00138E6096|nr:DUF4114 domain-containing protein [Synechocystis sp. CACIAM 05]QHV01465.1 hypothetical protein BWK47_15870 [Synechocystis sp. CACIAM 05]